MCVLKDVFQASIGVLRAVGDRFRGVIVVLKACNLSESGSVAKNYINKFILGKKTEWLHMLAEKTGKLERADRRYLGTGLLERLELRSESVYHVNLSGSVILSRKHAQV